MAINEIKEKIGVVKSVGGFANALQQIASMRMISLRDKVMSSKRFVDEATQMLRELNLYKELQYNADLAKTQKKAKKNPSRRGGAEAEDPAAEPDLIVRNRAVIVVSSNQGLCGKFNAEIFKQLESETGVFKENADADIFLIGKKGQEHYLTNKKYKFNFFPYELSDNFTYEDLLKLVNMFPYYDEILMVYSRFVNTVTRQVMKTLLVTPPTGNLETNKEETVQFLFEPSIDELIHQVSAKLRAAAFQQQILDSRLAQFSAQMVGMQAASENAKVLLEDLNHEYNKIRRKLIDKKISEVLAGKALW